MNSGDQFEMLAGDFGPGIVGFDAGGLRIRKAGLPSGMGELMYTSDVVLLDVASEESFKKTGGTIGWGLAGAAVFGPVGLLAGLVLGGKRKDVTFILAFNDGRKLLGKSDDKTFSKLRVLTFK